VLVKAGPTVSFLESPEFKLRTVAQNCPDGQVCFEPYIATENNNNVQAVSHIGLPLRPRYPFLEGAGSDDYENVNAAAYLPYPSLGFSLTDPADNFYVGAGIDITRGVALVGGLHIGRVDRLQQGYTVGTTFQRPTGTTVEIDEILDKSFRLGSFVSLSIDVGAIRRIFSLGNGGGSGAQ
jgi:hypothetical protein